MNKIILSIACTAVFVFSACTDFLAENPKSTLPGETYFSSAGTVQAGVNALYRIGPNSWYNGSAMQGSQLMQGGWAAGLFDNVNYKGQEPWIQWVQEFTDNENNVDTRMGSLFNSPYEAIVRANNVINILPGLNPVDVGLTAAQIERYIAEARFFRAQNYLWLVKHWGDIPMVTKIQTATDDLNVPRTAAQTIYEQVIIPDLLEAIRVLPVASQYNNTMRISAPVASAYLIDAYVQMSGFPVNVNKWAEAAAEAKKFLPGGAYSGIFALEENEDQTELSAYNKFRSVNVHTPSPGGRKLASCDEFIYVQEFMPVISAASMSHMAWPMGVSGLGTSECLLDRTNNCYKPMPRYLDMYDAANDLRMKDRQFFASYFIKKDGSILENPENDTPSAYFYYDHGDVTISRGSGRHYAIYRLAEMYLFAAEAIAKTEGITDQAVEALASVRARAYELGGISKETIVAELSALTVDQFIEQTWLEVYREFPYEYKQWNLIQRTRLYPKTNDMDATIPEGTAQFVDITTVGSGFSGTRLFTLDRLLWSFPLSQLQRNPNLSNNPGYEP